MRHEALSIEAAIPCYIVRYADDAVVLCRSEEHAKILKEEIAGFLRTTLKLELSAEKTLVTHADKGFAEESLCARRPKMARWES